MINKAGNEKKIKKKKLLYKYCFSNPSGIQIEKEFRIDVVHVVMCN